ncbi:MAG: ABC transporter ATP-binding protein [Proteobacteria bacterium]|nr:ABC transporter ATP-binding protein [Pseudomonadota bacterium]
MLELQGVNKRFGGLEVLVDLDLLVREGEITSVIGPNGAGKTTLFNVISGRFPPDSGRVVFQSRDITGRKPHRITMAGLARSFQVTNIFGRLTVLENLDLASQTRDRKRSSLLARAADRREVRGRSQAILERIGLTGRGDLPAGVLSHGDQRHLEIGMTLATQPRLLLLDEPTSGMSPAESASAIDLIRDLRSEVTILLIEHNMRLVMNLSDRIVVLDSGRKIAEGPPEQIARDPGVRRVYLGDA